MDTNEPWQNDEKNHPMEEVLNQMVEIFKEQELFGRDPLGLLTAVKQFAAESVSLDWDKLGGPDGLRMLQSARDYLTEVDLHKADLLFVTNMSWMSRTINEDNTDEYHEFALMMLSDLVKFYATKCIVDTYDMVTNITQSAEIH